MDGTYWEKKPTDGSQAKVPEMECMNRTTPNAAPDVGVGKTMTRLITFVIAIFALLTVAAIVVSYFD